MLLLCTQEQKYLEKEPRIFAFFVDTQVVAFKKIGMLTLT